MRRPMSLGQLCNMPLLKLTAGMPAASRPGRRRAGRQDLPGKAGLVLIILENDSAGTSHRVRKQINTLTENDYPVGVITRRHPRNEQFRKQPGVRLFEYPPPVETDGLLGYLAEYGYSFLAAAFFSLRALLSDGIEVVQFCQPPDIYFPLAWVLKRLGVRILIDQRDLLPELYVARFGRIRPTLMSAMRACERLSHRSAESIICTNEYQRDRVLSTSGLPDSRVSIVRNGPVLTHVSEAQSDESLKRGQPYLCCWVGAIGRQDRVDLLVQSINHVVHQLGRKDCQFTIIGPGECLANMQALTRHLGLDEWVHFTGDLPPEKVFQYLATADLGLDASLQSDVSPVKLFEYMAFGLPVVAFDLLQTRALSDGAAVLAEPGDVAGHARAVDDLLSRPLRRRELGRIGQAKVREKLAWDHQARTYAGVIEQLFRAEPLRPGVAPYGPLDAASPHLRPQ